MNLDKEMRKMFYGDIEYDCPNCKEERVFLLKEGTEKVSKDPCDNIILQADYECEKCKCVLECYDTYIPANFTMEKKKE